MLYTPGIPRPWTTYQDHFEGRHAIFHSHWLLAECHLRYRCTWLSENLDCFFPTPIKQSQMVFTYPLGIDRYVCSYTSVTLKIPQAIANSVLNAYTGFVAFYTIGAWLTFFLRCRVFSGFWDFRYSHTCYTLKYVMQFGLVNAGR